MSTIQELASVFKRVPVPARLADVNDLLNVRANEGAEGECWGALALASYDKLINGTET
jgi:hypothetical protein